MDNTYYLTYDLPIPYKDILFYPVTVKDALLFNVYSQCLVIDKDSIPNAEIISMTYLEYLYKATIDNMDETPYLLWFDRLLALSTRDETFDKLEESIKRYRYDEKDKPFFVIGEQTFYSEDFEEIRKIICEQNLVDLPDLSLSKEVRDSLEKAMEYKNKLSGNKSASFEDYLISVSVITGWTLEYIYSMSIRKFLKAVKRLDNYIHYRIYLAAAMSGMVEFKDKSFIHHWLSNIDDDDKYKEVSMSMDDMQNKISLESAK